MWINSGAADPYQVGQVQQLNNRPYLNTLVNIYDGTSISNQPVNLWKQDVQLVGVSNGLQYAPQTADTVRAYDSLYQRHFQYTADGQENLKTSDSRNI